MSDKFDPQPVAREDGGTDYKVPSCPNPCYWTDKEGAYVGQCDHLKVELRSMKCTGKTSNG